MSEWIPNDKVKALIRSTLVQIRGYKPGDLLDEAKFYRTGVITNLFGMGGITFSKSRIVMGRNVTCSTHDKWVSTIVFHELVHVAQQKDLGWFGFMATYIWEWIKCGFSYRRMKQIGIEKEAYAKQGEYSKEIGVYYKELT